MLQHIESNWKRMFQRSILRGLEDVCTGCGNVESKVSWRLLEMDVAMQHAERLGRFCNGCYNKASRTSWKVLKIDVTTRPVVCLGK